MKLVPIERIAADADARRLPQPSLRVSWWIAS